MARRRMSERWQSIAIMCKGGVRAALISKGGTSTIINCVYIGVIMSVSCKAKKRDELTPKVAVSVEG